MNFDLNAYLADPAYKSPNISTQSIAMRCKDGFKISIQASRTHYCSPRTDTGPWYKVELGFPSAEPEFGIMEYAENPEDPTGTVYAYVPISKVEQLVNYHGGPDYDAILARKQEILNGN